MGQGRPSGANYGAAHATIDLDLTALTAAPRVAQAAGEATAKALQQSLKIVQNEQRIAIAQAQQATAAVQAQQAQITATTRAESAERIAGARSEAAVIEQQARAQTATIIEEQKRQTAAFKQELKEQDRAQRQQSQVSVGSFGRSAASFAGAALGGPIGGLVGAATIGNPAIAAGLAVNQGARFALEATQLATAYNRQNVAAVQLAGSQNKLNALTVAYDKATGGAVDKATALSDVTRLQAIGFARSADQLTRFVTAARGSSVAMGRTTQEMLSEIQLAISNQSFRRLDQIGLGIDEVHKRMDGLKTSAHGMTTEAAFQEAILGLLEQKYGKLAKSVEAQATGAELAAKSWTNLKLAFGELTGGAVGGILGGLATQVDALAQRFGELADGINAAKDAQDKFNKGGGYQSGAAYKAANNFLTADPLGDFLRNNHFTGDITGNTGSSPYPFFAPNVTPSATIGSRSSLGSGLQQPFATMQRTPVEGEAQVHLNWAQGITDLDAKTHAAIIDEETSFGESRAKTVADYNKSVARDEAAYARSRLRQNLDQLDALASVAKDATRREQRETTDLARTQAQAEADSADKVAGIRRDANKRLADMEESYQADQAKAARHFHNSIIEAAGRLDAKAVAEAQRNYQEQRQDAKDAHDKQIKDNNDQLKERLDDEAKSLAKSLKQQQDAYDRQIAEGRANDALRLADMKETFTKQQAREAEDHGIQVTQRAQDQADELTAMDTQHNLRLEQIANHAQADRNALDEQAKIDLLALGVRNDAWQKAADKKEAAQEKLWDKFMAHVSGTLLEGRPNTPQMVPGFASGGYVPHDMMARVHAREFIFSTGMQAGSQAIPAPVRNAVAANGGGHFVFSGNINIYPTPNQSPTDIARAVRAEVGQIFKEIAS